MPSDNKSPQTSPFEIITTGKSKKVGKTGIIVGVSIAVFLILSVVAGVLLVRQQQNVQEKASTICTEACPRSGRPDLLSDCHPPQTDGSPDDKLCNLAGRVDTCGAAQTKYCCPSAGGAWTTNMSACATPTPTATATATATATGTGTATPTATATSTPNSCNKTCGSNSNCQSGLYCYSGYCRNPLCASDSSCGCGTKTATPTATATAKATTKAATGGTQTTPLPIPVTGTDWTTYVGVGVGAAAILISVLLAI
jgi:hypothetical protein